MSGIFRATSVALAVVLMSPATSEAVSFTLSSVVGDNWSYTLTYDPLDNYSIFQPSTTINVTGLSGVTSALGPTSTDFDPPGGFLDTINLDWTPAVLAGGTAVSWTHIGSGTGNFGEPKHVFGFTIIAPGAQTGLAALSTDGFERDTTNPLPDGTFDLDISTEVLGPTASAVPEPATGFLIGSGVLCLLRLQRRRRPFKH
jgi:PEP-CTERM motif